MSREVHVRFCERAGVRFPRATRPTLPVLDPGRGRTKTGRLWGYAVDDRPWGGGTPPAVVYLYAEDRKGEHPAAHLAGSVAALAVATVAIGFLFSRWCQDDRAALLA